MVMFAQTDDLRKHGLQSGRATLKGERG